MSVETIPFAEYLARPALSASGAKKLLKAPALYRHETDNPPESTPTFDFGKAAHKRVLGEGDPVEVLDYPDWRAAGVKAAKAEAIAAGRVPLLLKEWEVIEAMGAATKANPYAAGLLRKGYAEVSMFWQDEDTGIACKGRADWITRIGGVLTIVDYKTAASANPDDFRSACRRYLYDLQAAWYLDGAAACYGEEADFVFIAQEKKAPYLTSVVRLADVDIASAALKAQEARETYKRCSTTGEWPGYGIYTVDLPPSYEHDWSETA